MTSEEAAIRIEAESMRRLGGARRCIVYYV
jgi:hypothetical protein